MALSVASLNWTAFNLLTGQIILDSSQVVISGGDLSTLIGQVSTTTLTLHVDEHTPSPDWVYATEKGAAGWVAWFGDSLNPTIVWGGIVSQRVRVLGTEITIQLSTAEWYLDACPMGAYTATAVNQDTILNQIVTQFAAGTNQPAWQLIQSSTPSTTTQTVSYAALSNVSVLAALQALSAVNTGGVPGPEWFVGWVWNLAASTIKPSITYGQRIGHAAVGGVPNVTFELTDLLDGSAFTEDWTNGRGANSVTALGSPSSNATAGSIPSATATAINLQGRPVWTYVYTPNSQVSDPTILANYASKALTALQNGNQPLVAVFDINHVGKVFGIDWFLGDDIGWYLFGGLQFPTPISGVGRVIGVKLATNNTCTVTIQGAVLS